MQHPGAGYWAGDVPLRAVRAARRRVAGGDGSQDSLPLAWQARQQREGRRSGQRANRHAGALGCRRGRRRRAGRRGRSATHRTLPAPSAKGVDREIRGPSGSGPSGHSHPPLAPRQLPMAPQDLGVLVQEQPIELVERVAGLMRIPAVRHRRHRLLATLPRQTLHRHVRVVAPVRPRRWPGFLNGTASTAAP